jgi:hypothetical protein
MFVDILIKVGGLVSGGWTVFFLLILVVRLLEIVRLRVLFGMDFFAFLTHFVLMPFALILLIIAIVFLVLARLFTIDNFR